MPSRNQKLSGSILWERIQPEQQVPRVQFLQLTSPVRMHIAREKDGPPLEASGVQNQRCCNARTGQRSANG